MGDTCRGVEVKAPSCPSKARLALLNICLDRTFTAVARWAGAVPPQPICKQYNRGDTCREYWSTVGKDCSGELVTVVWSVVQSWCGLGAVL